MKRYFVEIDRTTDMFTYVNEHDSMADLFAKHETLTTIGMYIFAYSEDQIREMFKTYRLVTVDITE